MKPSLGRALKWSALGLGTLIVTLAVVLAGVALWLVRSVPASEGESVAAGLGAPVRIMRDSHGIPHVVSADGRDAFVALGRLHAEDRLFQMELFRRFGRGELAAVAGSAAVPADTYARTLGIARMAEADYAAASPALKAVLEAYAEGVNSWIAGRDRPLPPEFTLLMTEPAPWRPSDSLVLGKLLGMMLTGNWQGEALRSRLAARLDGETLEFLTPPTGGGPAIDGAGTLAPFAALPALRRALDFAFEVPGADQIGAGASNAWAVAGERTATGKPILANDPHLGLMAPGLWYLVHLAAPDLAVVGATIPGIPMPLLGHNGHVAWGLTTTNGDAADLFIETVDPADPTRYLTPDGPRPFELREERIEVRFGEPVTVTIRSTRHGPVVSDLAAGSLPRAEGTVVALAHAALQPGDKTPEALLGFVAAKDADDFLAAARQFHSPQQNLTYADTKGTIGMVSAGRLPVRKSGDGRMPADGASGAGDWTGFVPFEALPQVRRPGSGVVLNANNAVTGPDYPVLVGKDYDVPYRAERLAALLAAKPAGYTLDDAAAGQADTLSPFSVEFIAPLIALHGPAEGRPGEALAILAAWDRRMSADSPAPLIAMAWARDLNRRLFAGRLGEDYGGWAGLRPVQLRAVLNGQGQWCDDPATPAAEDCRTQARAALDGALAQLAAQQGETPADWRWGKAHVADMRHPILRFLPVLSGWTAIRPPVGGGEDTLLRGAMRFGARDNPFANVHAAGFRAVYDLADLSRSRFIISTGQSGNPYSPHWDDLSGIWAADGYVEIPTAPEKWQGPGYREYRLLPSR
ncbi:penicillin acylase family protein [Zavarzinia compransoris]|uniref:Penicillin acylase family protein n=1 Tax=Zavarzinia compransoris TaxID=1264899 RepID=A0A317ED42_9PROT|nr:penicillin acylase family protein [Zavarzinia compransoris]PWR23273.1 penicillin acylase family protein [Zavarzinia compransoris]TDP46160.1 penicillin amidase [Zavarzinia compransoris]